jgi:hypothetical protein
MRFGKSAEEAAEEPGRGGGGGNFIKYLKPGDNTVRILQEPTEWKYYWEHFSPAGFSFPCPRDKDDPMEMCPGCASDNEKMKKVNRRIAFNVLHSFNGNEYVDAMKIGPMVAEKLDNRYKRFGTVTDRDYTITKYKTSSDRWDFDVEGNTVTPVDLHKEEWKDIEALLQQAWDDAWGDPNQAAANKQASESTQALKLPTIAPTPKQSENPPFEEEKVYNEADLRHMQFSDLVVLVQEQMKMSPPTTLKTPDAVVDWLMELQS